MKAEFSVLLSGLGYYKLSEQRRRLLWIVLGASLAVHVVALLIFGSYVVIRQLREERTVFTAPPPLKTYEPRKLEHRVKVQKRQRSSSRPQITPRMVAAKLSNLALPEIKTDPKVIKTSFQPKFQAITGTGLGAGLGTGLGLGGFGQGVSQFDFFGIRGRGDKIAILVDVSGSMIEDDHGGPKGYMRVKARIAQVIDALNENALFNVVAFADAAQTFEEKMVPATEAYKQKAKLFLQPYNTSFENAGLTAGNVRGSDLGLQARGGTTRLDLALTAAFQQGADTILVISDGLPRVIKEPTAEEMEAWNAKMAQWRRDHEAEIEAAQRAAASAPSPAPAAPSGPIEYKEKKVWVPPTKFREGGPPPREGHWVTRRVPKNPPRGANRPRGPRLPRPPGMPESMKWWTFQDFVKHFGILQQELYAKKGKKPPIVHCIGYAIDKEGGDFLRDLAKQYKGNYRRVAAM